MATFLTHPVHGIHIAATQDEVEVCIANGWQLKEEQKEIAAQNEDTYIDENKPTRGRPRAK